MIVGPSTIRVGRAKCTVAHPGGSFLPRGAHHRHQPQSRHPSAHMALVILRHDSQERSGAETSNEPRPPENRAQRSEADDAPLPNCNGW